jgi:hypothetical protein
VGFDPALSVQYLSICGIAKAVSRSEDLQLASVVLSKAGRDRRSGPGEIGVVYQAAGFYPTEKLRARATSPSTANAMPGAERVARRDRSFQKGYSEAIRDQSALDPEADAAPQQKQRCGNLAAMSAKSVDAVGGFGTTASVEAQARTSCDIRRFSRLKSRAADAIAARAAIRNK